MRDVDPAGRRAHRGRPARGRDRPAARASGRRARWPRRCACRSTRATSWPGGRRHRCAGRRDRRRDAAPAVRQRARPATGGWSLQRTVALDRPGQVARPLLAPLEDRAPGGPASSGLADSRPRPIAGGIQFYRAYAGTRPTGTDQLAAARRRPEPPGRDSTPRASPSGSASTCRACSRIPGSATTSFSRAAIRSTSPSTTPSSWCRARSTHRGRWPTRPGKNLDWYVDAAGGYTQAGDNRHSVRHAAER